MLTIIQVSYYTYMYTFICTYCVCLTVCGFYRIGSYGNRIQMLFFSPLSFSQEIWCVYDGEWVDGRGFPYIQYMCAVSKSLSLS